MTTAIELIHELQKCDPTANVFFDSPAVGIVGIGKVKRQDSKEIVIGI